jgi:hypothetical protein
MDFIMQEYDPSDKFLIELTRMKFGEFYSEFYAEGDSKKLRNDYDNRLKPKNIVLYHMHYLMKEKENVITRQFRELMKNKKNLKKEDLTTE